MSTCSKTTTVDTVADLQTLFGSCSPDDVTTAIVLGYHEKNDGGGGIFVYDPSLTTADNDNGLIFYKWRRSVVDSSINVKWFGAKDDDGDGLSSIEYDALRDNNTLAFQNALTEHAKRYKDIHPDNPGMIGLSNRISKSGIFIPSGEYIIGENSLYSNTLSIRLVGLHYFSDGNAILTLANGSSGYAFNNNNSALYVTFSDITFTCLDENTNVIYSYANGGAQDYYFERCNFFGKFKRVFTVRGINNNSEWSFNKCAFDGNFETVLDVKDSDQFLSYWFDQCKFWLKEGKTLKAMNGGNFNFINCDWSGLNPSTETYQFELIRNTVAPRSVNGFRIINARFELKSDFARVLKTNWAHGSIEIVADFSSQLGERGYDLKHFDFDLSGPSTNGYNALNVNFKNSIMAGYHEFNYGGSSWRGIGNILYENCSFPERDTLDGFIKINHGTNLNKSGIAIIEVKNAIFENNHALETEPTNDAYNMEVSSVDYLPLFSNKGLKKKYFNICHSARGGNPINDQEFILNFPEEAESIITKIKWFLP